MSGMATEVGIVVGTRPEIIKLSPVIRELENTDELNPYLIHTNQHYDRELSDVFFGNLDLPPPDAHLNVGSGTQGEQTAKALIEIEAILREHSKSVVLAQGDTNAALSTALAASKLPTSFGHVEAGIRSFDRTMPEEINRVLADHVTDLAFAPTETAASYLADEGITENVHVTGNTVVDACLDHVSVAETHSSILDQLGLTPDEYAVVTIHRPHNTDNSERLETILTELDALSLPAILPTHPRTQEAIEDLSFEPDGSLELIDPIDYLDFLNLEQNALVAITDSGGVQEESSILEVPCLTVRPNTERPETVDAGVNALLEPDKISDRVERLVRDDAVYNSMTGCSNLYGDGNAAERIVALLLRYT